MTRTLHCSFCGKSEKQIEKLAAGPGGIHICNECVEACLLIMDGAGAGMKRRFDPRNWPTDRLLAILAPVSATLETYREHLQQRTGRLQYHRAHAGLLRAAEPINTLISYTRQPADF